GLHFEFVEEGGAPPLADAGPDQFVRVGQTVRLDGSRSSDPDGDPIRYQWAFTSIPAGSGAALDLPNSVEPAFVADLPGVYVVQLMVDDGETGSSPDTVSVVAGNEPPTADAGMDRTV